MGTYYEENRILLEKLQHTHVEEIHGIRMEIKDIPDPVTGTVLDPRVFKNRLAEAQKENMRAECLTIPVDEIRKDKGYPNRDITSTGVKKEERSIDTRNGVTKLSVFTPGNLQEKEHGKPVMVYFHGGAFIAGSTDIVQNFCRLLSELADMIVVSAEYRLAPEHHFPDGLYDCYDTVDWIFEHASELFANPRFLAVGGDSAGGTLAIGCCLLEQEAVRQGRQKQNRICFQALLYPGVLVDNFKLEDYKWRLSDYEIPEEDLLAMGAAVSLKAMTAEMPLLYMGEEGHVKHPLAAPLCAKSLVGLPRTLMILCEYDYLRLSAEAFSRKLKRDQVASKTVLYRGMDHAFIDKVGDYPQAYDAAAEIAKEMKEICGN